MLIEQHFHCGCKEKRANRFEICVHHSFGSYVLDVNLPDLNTALEEFRNDERLAVMNSMQLKYIFKLRDNKKGKVIGINILKMTNDVDKTSDVYKDIVSIFTKEGKYFRAVRFVKLQHLKLNFSDLVPKFNK